MSSSVVDMFLQCDQAIRLIHIISRADKEFHFQNWFQERLDELEGTYDLPARNSYPNFRLVRCLTTFTMTGSVAVPAYSGASFSLWAFRVSAECRSARIP